MSEDAAEFWLWAIPALGMTWLIFARGGPIPGWALVGVGVIVVVLAAGWWVWWHVSAWIDRRGDGPWPDGGDDELQ